MKKIVGIIAAVAMAASVFAFDWSGAMKTKDSVFAFDGNNIQFFKQDGLDSGGPYWGTRLQVTAYVEKAGAQFALAAPKRWQANKFQDALITDWKVYIQPIDQLRINLGPAAGKYKVAGGNEDWMNISRTGDLGITLEIKPIDGLEFDLGILGSDNETGYWLTGNNAGVSIGQWGAVAKYKISDDVGTIGIMLSSAGSAKPVTIAAGWDGKIGDSIALAVDAAVDIGSKVSNLKGDVYFQANLDELTLRAYVQISHSLAANANVGIKPYFRIDYALDSVGIYFRVNNDGDYTYSTSFPGIRLEPGITFNCGAAALETSLSFKIAPGAAAPFTVEMPFAITVGL